MGASGANQTYIAGNGHVGDHGWKIRVKDTWQSSFLASVTGMKYKTGTGAWG